MDSRKGHTEMLTMIKVLADETITLPTLGATPSNSFILNKVDGLTPPDLNLFIGDYARDGGVYSGRRVEKRAINMMISLNPRFSFGETVSSLRSRLYEAFIDPSINDDMVTLALYEDSTTTTKVVQAYVEKFEGAEFERDTTVNIALVAPSVYIRDMESTTLTPPPWITTTLPYEGSAEAGFEMEIEITAASSTLVIKNNVTNPNPEVRVDPTNYLRVSLPSGASLEPGDKVVVNTSYGRRVVNMTRGGVTYTLLSSFDPASRWIQFKSRSNHFQVSKDYDDATNIGRVVKTTYTANYWGV